MSGLGRLSDETTILAVSMPAGHERIVWSTVSPATTAGESAGTRNASLRVVLPSAANLRVVLAGLPWIGVSVKPPTGISKSRYCVPAPFGLLELVLAQKR